MLANTATALRPARAPAPGGSMIVTPHRLVYSGLLGAPSCRTHGATTVYVAHETPFEISIDGAPRERAWLAVVPPKRSHEIASSDRLMRDILIEPESARGAEFGCGPALTVASRSDPAYVHLRQAFDTWLAGRDFTNASTGDLDRFFFGRALAPCELDPRIRRVVNRIRSQPHEQVSAVACAQLSGLSFSRFVHLFKQEIGMTFRAFCAWKRARAVLPSMTGPCNLTQLALEAGYPDSTHFSHSIRRIFGLRPRDILAGSRRLALHCSGSTEGLWTPTLTGSSAARTHTVAAFG